MKILSDEIATNLCTLCIYSNDKDDNKEYIVCSINDWIIIFTIILNIVVMRYFSFYFNIEQLTRFFNPITGILSLSIINVLVALWIIRENKSITLFIRKNQLIVSAITALFTTLFYIIKPTLMSTYYSAIEQATSELTLNSTQQYPIFRELFLSITIETVYFVSAITVAFEITTFLLSSIPYNKENNTKKTFHFPLFSLLIIFFFSATHIPYLIHTLKKVLTNQNISYLIVKYEYYSLGEKCNNPKLIELSQTNQYRFKFISHNKVIYVERMWDKDINKEEWTSKNITKYNFYPDKEECIKFE
ncbi:hypothetical protein [Avibacterium sp. 21-599]|uniref:hypothetical protein n=1 Tax=Avibacterium sp. 21-599 TaxID=2911528 RepID=UPI00224522DA|nr:hypothetical protein [Avibacterium sp. 21-599]MCW9718423.1 hypothetical protein [Avibacterium sp. 21-599]